MKVGYSQKQSYKKFKKMYEKNIYYEGLSLILEMNTKNNIEINILKMMGINRQINLGYFEIVF